jgi:S-adenosylmethionine decarboxylase
MDLVFNTLNTLPEKIGMTKIMPPYVFKYQGTVPEDWGVSGVVLIAESHITIHTFPEKSHAFIDIFSCKDFDTAPATAILIDLFEASNYDVQLSTRGQEFPRNIQKAAEIVSKERTGIQSEQPRVYN